MFHNLYSYTILWKQMIHNIVPEDLTIDDYKEENNRLRVTVTSVMSQNEKLRKSNKHYRVELVKTKKAKLMEIIKLTKRNVSLIKTNTTMQHKMNEMKQQLEDALDVNLKHKMNKMKQQLEEALDVNLKCPITMCDDDIDYESIDIELLIEQDTIDKKNKKLEKDDHNETNDQKNKNVNSEKSEVSINSNPEDFHESITKNDVEDFDKTSVSPQNVVNSEESDQPPVLKKNRRDRKKNVRKRTKRNKRRSVRIRNKK